MLSVIRLSKTRSRLQHFYRNASAAIVASTLFCLSLLSGCGMGTTAVETGGHSAAVTGSMYGGQEPVTGALLQLYAVGTAGDGSTATPLMAATLTTSDGSGNSTNSNANAGNALNTLPPGSFTIANQFTCPSPSTQVYLVGTGGNPGLSAGKTNPALAMLAVLGPCGGINASTTIQINELTTVGSLAALAPYMNGYASLGSGSADASQFATALDLVRAYTDSTHGTVPGPSLPAGFYASSLEVTTLGDILASCVNSDGTGVCQQLFTLATPPGGTKPSDTIGAAIDILKFPANNAAQIFNLLAPDAPFQPTLLAAPGAWTLPISPYAATPVISPAGGSYTTAPAIAITDATPGAVIHYTVDGSTPTASSAVYMSSFNLTGSATVKAVAVLSGYATSVAASAQYTLPATGVASHLAFISQPGNTAVGYSVPSFTVGIFDAYGNKISTSGISITASLGSNPGSAILGGTLTAVTGKDGIATFSTLTVDAAAVGYTLNMSGGGFGTITSDPFAVYPYKVTPSQTLLVVGVGKTTTGTVTIGAAAPAGGVVVSLVITNPAVVTISSATVTIPAGSTTATYTITGVTAGSTTLTSSATNYASGTLTESAAAASVTFGTIPTAGPGINVTVPITLTAPAPAGGLTVNLYSSNTGSGNLSPSTITFNAGATTPTTTVTFGGVGYGTTDLTAVPTLPSFGGETRTISTGSNTATLTATLAVNAGTNSTDTLTLGTAAPAGGLTFTLSSTPANIVTIPSTVTVAGGSKTATFTVTAKGLGTTTIHASASGIADATTVATVNSSFTAYPSSSGISLTMIATANLGVAPAQAIDVTITSSNPAVLLLTTNPAVTGSSSIVIHGVTTNFISYYVQGLAVGNSTITISAAGYTDASFVQPVSQSKLLLPAGFSNTTVNGPRALSFSIITVNSAGTTNFQCLASCTVSPGVTLTAGLASSDTTIFTPDSTVVIPSGTNSATANVTPGVSGTATLYFTSNPPGFADATGVAKGVVGYTYESDFKSSGLLTYTAGAGVYIPITESLQTPPASAVTVTVSVANPTLALLSTAPGGVGSPSLTFTGITSTIPTVYVQGIAVGTTALTYSAPRYVDLTTNLAVNHAGVIFTSASPVTLNTASTLTSSLTTALAIYNTAGTGIFVSCTSVTTCGLLPSTSNQVTIASSNPSVATVTNSPLTLGAAGTATGTITAATSGTTTFTIPAQPSPLTPITNATYSQIVANVTAPTLTLSASSTGAGLYVTASATLSPSPATAKTVTLTSGNPAVAVLSLSPTTLGSAAVSVSSTGGAIAYYVQGISPGTTTVTFSAPGYTTGTATITVLPSGVVFSSVGNITSTGSFSPTSTLTAYLVELNATTGAVTTTCGPNFCALNPGSSVTATVSSSNTNVGNVGSNMITFAPNSYTSTATFIPNDTGATVLTIGQPANFGAPATGTSTTITVTGSTISLSPIATGMGVYVKQSINLPTAPGVPITVTVSLADPTLGKLSLDPAVMSTSSTLVFNNISAAASSATGGIPPFYIQGVASGYTRLVITARGYYPYSAPVAVYKTGITLFNISTAFASDTVPTSGTARMGGLISLLDPYSQSWVSDCATGIVTCLPNPGVTPGFTLATDDPTVGVFQPSIFDSATGLYYAPYTGLKNGVTNVALATQSDGFVNTTTPSRRTGMATAIAKGDTTYALVIESHDIDAGAGVQVIGNVSLSGTTTNILSLQLHITIADPTIAVLSLSPSTAGSSTVSVAGLNYNNNNFYVQGLKAGTTTITITGDLYVSRTITVNVRPAGFAFRQAENRLTTASNRDLTNIPVTPVVLNDAGQWLANAQLNPGTSATVPIVDSTPSVGTVVNGVATFAANATTGYFNFHPVATSGTTTLTLGAPSGIFTQATTYQAVTATIQ